MEIDNESMEDQEVGGANDDIEDEDLLNVEVPITNDDNDDDGSNNGTPTKLLFSATGKKLVPNKPRDGFVWNDSAILECMNVSLDSYNKPTMTDTSTSHWNPPPTTSPTKKQSTTNQYDEEAKNHTEQHQRHWKPGNMPVPGWAVDPLIELTNNE